VRNSIVSQFFNLLTLFQKTKNSACSRPGPEAGGELDDEFSKRIKAIADEEIENIKKIYGQFAQSKLNEFGYGSFDATQFGFAGSNLQTDQRLPESKDYRTFTNPFVPYATFKPYTPNLLTIPEEDLNPTGEVTASDRDGSSYIIAILKNMNDKGSQYYEEAQKMEAMRPSPLDSLVEPTDNNRHDGEY
jgi:hypothetical protein